MVPSSSKYFLLLWDNRYDGIDAGFSVCICLPFAVVRAMGRDLKIHENSTFQ